MAAQESDWSVRKTSRATSREEGIKLAEIDRPYTLSSIEVPLGKQAVQIDNSISILYNLMTSETARRKIGVEELEPALWVNRDRTLPVVFSKNEPPLLFPKTRKALDRDRGRRDTIFVKAQTDRPLFYVGLDYEFKIVEVVPTEHVVFDLRSVNPVTSEMIEIPTTDEIEYLKGLPRNQ